MKRLVAVLLVLAALLCAADRKRKPAKPPELEVLEAKAQRVEGRMLVDGRVRNTGEKPIVSLNLLFDFMNTDAQAVTTRRYAFEDEVLGLGQEAGFQLYLADPVRAVTFQVRAETGRGMDLRVAHAGPFPIE
jgi:hypothetical protein